MTPEGAPPTVLTQRKETNHPFDSYKDVKA